MSVISEFQQNFRPQSVREIRFEFTKNSVPCPSVLSQLGIARMLSLTVLLLATPAVLGKIHADDDMVIVEGKSEARCSKFSYVRFLDILHVFLPLSQVFSTTKTPHSALS